MVQILTLLSILLLFACTHQTERNTETSFQTTSSIDSIYQKPDKVEESNNEAKLIIPDELFLDTITIFDSSKALTINIILPKSKNENLFAADRLLTTIINEMKEEFIKNVDKMLKEDKTMLQSASGNTFHVWPEELYKEENTLSFLLVINIQHAGAAHPKTDYYSFNYDIEKQEKLNFSNYFTIETKIDSVYLLNKINLYFNDRDIRTEKLYDFDFNFNKQTIYFNFDDYEIASYAYGRKRAEFDKKELFEYISKNYRQ